MRAVYLFIFTYSFLNLISQDTLLYSNLSKSQYSSWKEIENNWLKEKYYPFLKKEKIKLNCSGCESAYVQLVFKKDSSQTKYTIIKTKQCGEAFKGKLLLELKKILNQIILPEEFNNTIFKTQLGSALKC